ncbi:MAG: restriction endonuclease subunit S [Veillonella sp.]|uniref:restriction endonuclease subunit S n=1 Tax=Veillonella sp. TaxID=1926307 RepID=UPI002579F4BF|nr:restriction endonuclease subunit S [Veillonella sp.]MBS6127899.1 restriction endonuclease subunit S [Veillonella sp.]
MSKEKRRVPKLRFPGFTEDWEQRKLGDIATFSKGNGYSKSDLAPSGDPIILYGRLYTNYETTIRNVDTFVELKDKSVISQGDEVIVPASGETVEDISRASVVKDQGVIIGGDLNVIKVNHLLDPTFLALTISNGEQQKELSKRAQGKSVVHLHNSDLQEVNLTFPLLNEQKEISTLFEKMDSIITLHQRKLNNLKLKKKALLQKLFPKNGERYPELRFPGFTDAWEQRKLSDILKVNSGKDYKHLEQGDIPVYGTGGYMLSVNESLSNIDAIGIGRKGTIDKPQYLKAPFWTVDTLFYLTALDKHSILFLYYLMQLMPWKKFDESTGVPSLSKTTIDNINGYVPSNPKEEELISALFNQLDKSITLHQRKLDHLQLQKKALLQQMFV